MSCMLTFIVFLRTLEFYTGVLFLTTNRVGVLDEAIKSRLTYTAYYPPLNAAQTRDIWKLNLRLLQERKPDLDIDDRAIMAFAKRHFEINQATNSTWNGRQIQNAFKVASALADWDDTFNAYPDNQQHSSQPAIHRRPQLLPQHFDVIADGTRAFDIYLQEATGQNDADRAHQEMVRAHDEDFELAQQMHDPRFVQQHERRQSMTPSPVQTYQPKPMQYRRDAPQALSVPVTTTHRRDSETQHRIQATTHNRRSSQTTTHSYNGFGPNDSPRFSVDQPSNRGHDRRYSSNLPRHPGEVDAYGSEHIGSSDGYNDFTPVEDPDDSWD